MAQIPADPIAVIGAGSWGTALALLLARNGNEVRLWGNEVQQMQHMQSARVNAKYLPDYPFPDHLQPCVALEECLVSVRDVLIAVPSHVFASVLQTLKPHLPANVRVSWGTKGLDPKTKLLPHQLVMNVFSPQTPAAVIAGPSFAKEVAAGLPTAVSLAGNDELFMQSLIERLHNDCFRVYRNDDIIGVQLCGVVKNVLAIAVGISDGLQLGANARAALITRGLAEMTRLCKALGGQSKTLMSLAGVGDLVLTCTDDQSRNRRFGLALGKGIAQQEALTQIGQAVEGRGNALQLFELAQQYQLDMPITEQVHAILYENASTKSVVAELLERAPKAEL